MSFINFTEARCKNCYKCLRKCPVKGIRFKDNQAEIVEERCIACGRCFEVCPQEARKIDSDLMKVKESISSGKKVIVSLAPSALAYFDMSFIELISRIKGLGFNKVRETAEGAQFVIQKYREHVQESEDKIFITSCCPSINYLIRIYYPHLSKYLMPYESPMVVHGLMIKEEEPNAEVVFIGPCVGKMIEKEKLNGKDSVDYVITFDELKTWFEEMPESKYEIDESISGDITEGRKFPVDRGIVMGLSETLNNKGIKPYVVDGFHKSLDVFNSLSKGNLKNAFIEANICIGSCIGGPSMGIKERDFYESNDKVERFIEENYKNTLESQSLLGTNDYLKGHIESPIYEEEVSREEINRVLKEMGKNNEQDKLNCGVCGYPTCEAKAIAIIRGMSEKDMCLHFMRSKAESLSNIIFENTVNSVIIVDSELNILEMNPIAQKTFMAKIDDYKGIPLATLMDDSDFKEVLRTKVNIEGKTVENHQYGVVFKQNISYLEKEDILIGVMMNITEEKKNKNELYEVKKKTLDAAQEVIEKQMRVAQEIAGLLGETTAETKIILNRLRRVVAGENGAEK
ncbi:[Fe-Fe] hydrogenase large subunit C-terminal domain-containing protein [Oceanirhabdus sp. W0125-5]|uniref:[Fe-Fe] hydrogenase large subunit C-terminal domain-containing protein n=1 Tax=Oceanirhabdus sp. W0125-5 TaxID=2999116 RepID=UPI0022F2B567|nr:[Fe-Fe] hydrogenase large subunit C-terminal domain-containing protein [Oceanirhabdus sp. W0125-5]WBW98203.1 [Fe-Fe] hydrogenase large subunit C-terminal domain-containing protein [Oceanirhabdus sp. W0125-5]